MAIVTHGLREPTQKRSRDSVDRIVNAALDLLSHGSLGDLSVSEVCIAADVSPSTFYLRFKDRDALLEYLFELYKSASIELVERQFRTLIDEDITKDTVVGTFRAYIDFLAAYGALRRAFFSVLKWRKRQRVIDEHLIAVVSEFAAHLQQVSPEADLERVYFAIRSAGWMLDALVRDALLLHGHPNVDDRSLELCALATMDAMKVPVDREHAA